jgi:sugar lactone lactonase YvrE
VPAAPALADFRIDPAKLDWVGTGLQRPECVLATARGTLYSADWRGGVAQVAIDGKVTLWRGALPDNRPLRPNGIALRRDGSFLLADLGETRGGLFALSRDGSVRPVLEAVDGVDLPPSNFVTEDREGRIWLTVSTRRQPRQAAWRADVADGFIVCIDRRGARIAMDGLGYTNEALVSPDGQWLYVNETFARRLSRFPLGADGTLGAREVVTVFGAGTFPDGLTFDAAGGVWITAFIANRVIRVDRDGGQHLVMEDCDAAALERVEAAYLAGTMRAAHASTPIGRSLKSIASLAFGGPDLRTAYLGCLLGDSIATFRSPVAGVPPVHWHY